jgi:putative hydrolase of the HAD superfamily
VRVTRAVIFDLDDTLYPERRFVLSGFAAVAAEAERLYGIPRGEAFGVLRRSLGRGRRGQALQDLAGRFLLPADSVRWLRSFFRGHDPRLRLPMVSAKVVLELRRDWKVGILTNGTPDVQARKVAALGLAGRVDHVVYAMHTGPGKPDAAAFDTVLGRLEASASESVFVGDDPVCDIEGARRMGLKTVRVRGNGIHRDVVVDPANEADWVVDSIAAVPSITATLLDREACHVA